MIESQANNGSRKYPLECGKRTLFIALLLSGTFLATSCTAVAVTGAVVGGAVAVTSATVKTTGAAVGAVIPDNDEEEDKQEDPQ